MAEVKLVYPAKGLTAPSSWGSKESIKKMMERIKNDYGTFIRSASIEANLPEEMITSFIAVVSTGAITEAGIFNALTAGTMLCRTTFPVVNKAAGDSIVITWVVTIS